MKADQDFAAGYQWSKEEKDDRYTANLTLRIIAQRVAFFYAKNPKFDAHRRARIMNTVWDGDQSSLMALQQAASQVSQQVAMGVMDPMMAQQAQQQTMPILQDAARVKSQEEQLNKIGKTLELLFRAQIDQATHDFKQMMKMVVRRASTTGVGYVKLGFERVMQKKPDIEQRLADISNRLSTLERLSADLHDDQTDENGPEAEQLRLLMNDLGNQMQIVVREGLTFDYPASMNIIPDPKTISLREFLGADWVAEEYILSPNDVKEIYDVDVGKQFNAYKGVDDGVTVTSRGGFVVLQDKTAKTDTREGNDGRSCCIWEVYNRKDGMVYTLCDGYKDFIREPASPEVHTDRFWPWFTLTLNEVDHETMIFPPSDVKLIRDMQMDYNRGRQGVREHRRAARPKTIVAAGMVDQEDLEKLSNHPDNAIIELNGLAAGAEGRGVAASVPRPAYRPEPLRCRADVHRHDARVWHPRRQHRRDFRLAQRHPVEHRGSFESDRDGLQHRRHRRSLDRDRPLRVADPPARGVCRHRQADRRRRGRVARHDLAADFGRAVASDRGGLDRTPEPSPRDRQRRAHLPDPDAGARDQARVDRQGVDQAPRRQDGHHHRVPVDAAFDHRHERHGLAPRRGAGGPRRAYGHAGRRPGAGARRSRQRPARGSSRRAAPA